jgi:hypothetical protein
MLVSIHWGSTNLKLDSNEKLMIARQVLQAKKSHVIHQYKQHCFQVDIKPISDRKLYDILNSLRATQQKSITGMDDFVKAASDAWITLEQLINQLSMHQNEKDRLMSSIDKCRLYLKASYSTHCSDNSEIQTHCTVYALSQSSNRNFYQNCDHIHEFYCEGKNFFL